MTKDPFMGDNPAGYDEAAERFAIGELHTLRSRADQHQELAFRLMGWYATIMGAIAYGVYFRKGTFIWWLDLADLRQQVD